MTFRTMSKGACALTLAFVAACSGTNRVGTTDAGSYPFGSPAFHRFVLDSYRAAGRKDVRSFQAWMERAAPVRPGRAGRLAAWTAEMDARRLRRGRLTSSVARAAAERREAADLHRWEKRAIPRFSLDRGFEFTAVVSRGERQCLLQSVLLASLLQRSGIDAGAVMVFRNGAGEDTNLGHVVTLVKLATGRDVLADASHQEPFVRQTGLFARVAGGGYRFLKPVFAPGSMEIVAYRTVATGAIVPVNRVRGLDNSYLRSQFSYYRGERTLGGVLSSRPTPAGLRAQARWLRDSLALCPSNPLSTYLLGWVYLKSGQPGDAYRLLDHACRLYTRAGWMPDGPRSTLARAKSEVRRAVARGAAHPSASIWPG